MRKKRIIPGTPQMYLASLEPSARLRRIAKSLAEPGLPFVVEDRGKDKLKIVQVPLVALTQISLQLEDIAAEIE